MMRLLGRVTGTVPVGSYVELVGSLFATRLPTLVMSALFVMVGSLAVAETRDPVLALALVAGMFSSLVRVAVLLHDWRLFQNGAVALDVAAAVERRFAATYLTFAAILGAFGARSFAMPVPDLHVAIAVLLTGYAAGVAAGTALRPWISISSLMLALVPSCLVAASTSDMLYQASAVCLLGFLGGGIRSILRRYRSEAGNIAMRLAFSTLARQDHLTRLPNRLALAEYFAKFASEEGHAGVAVHCLDLDDFKPLNDAFGHAAGDALLVAAADRLRDLIRGRDFAARLGGDEFIFVQTGIREDHEAATMALRLERRLGEPYVISGERMVLGASVGFAVCGAAGEGMEELVEAADQDLRRRKAERKSRSSAPVVSIGAVRMARAEAASTPDVRIAPRPR